MSPNLNKATVHSNLCCICLCSFAWSALRSREPTNPIHKDNMIDMDLQEAIRTVTSTLRLGLASQSLPDSTVPT